MPHISRRTILGSLVSVPCLAACGPGSTARSTDVASSSWPTVPAASPSTASVTSTPEPTVAVTSVVLDSQYINQGNSGVCGFFTDNSNELTFYPATGESATTYSLSVDSTYSQITWLSCPELTDESPVGAVVAAYCKKPGGGLEAEAPVIVWATIGSTGEAISMNETPVPVSGNATFERISLIRGKIVVVFQDGDNCEHFGISQNSIAWTFTAKSETEGTLNRSVTIPGQGNDLLIPTEAPQVMAVINQGSGIVNKKLRVMMTATTGIWDQTKEYFVADTSTEPDGNVIRSHGPSLFRKSDGSRFNKHDSDSVVIDHIRNRAVLTYPTTDSESSSDVKPDPGAPGMEVVDLSTEKVIFTLPRKSAAALGGVTILAAIDNHLVLSSKQGIKLVLADSGKNDPEDPPIPANTFRMTNIVAESGPNWALLSGTNGFGDWPDGIKYSGIVTKGSPLAWADIPAVEAVSM